MREPSDEAAPSLNDRTDGGAGDGRGAASRAPERRCILTGKSSDRALLIRLVADDEGTIWPDLSGKLPGRGAWIAPDRAALEKAMAKGRLRGLIERGLRRPVRVPEGLADQLATGLTARAMGRLGLEHRAGNLILGGEKLAGLVGARRIFLLMHAKDASVDGVRRFLRLWRAAGCDDGRFLSVPADRAALARALGRLNPVHIGVGDQRAAARILRDMERWVAFSADPETASGGREASGQKSCEGRE